MRCVVIVRGARWLVFSVCVVAAMSGMAAPAAAHAVLERTAPADGAVLGSSPGVVGMVFDEQVGISLGSIMVYDSRGRRVDKGGPYHPAGDGKAVSERIPADLPAGGYVVTWRVVSADSHPVHGAFTFQIGAAGSRTALRGEATSLLARGQGSRVVGAVFGVDRALGFLALAVLVGGMLLLALAWRVGAAEVRVRWLLWGAWLVAIIATAAGILLQGPYGAGLPLRDAFSPSVVDDVLQSRFGQLSLIRLVALAVAGWLLHLLLGVDRRARPGLPRWWTPAAAITATVILLTVGLAGHAGAGRWVVLAIPFDFVHLAGVATWVGGLALVVTGLLIRRAGSAAIPHHAIMVFSQLALLSIIAIAGSGSFAAWRQVGSLGNLTTTTYGRLVLIKVGLFCVIVVLGLSSRLLTHGALDPLLFRRRESLPLPVSAGDSAGKPALPPAVTPVASGGAASLPERRRTRLRLTTTTELVVACAVLAVAALLVNAEPARLAAARPLAAEVHAGPDALVDVTLDSTRAGPNNLHVYTLSRAGTQLIVPEVRATLTLPARGITDLPVHLSIAGAGHFVSVGLNIPLSGRWTLNLIVRTSAFDEYPATPVTFSLR